MKSDILIVFFCLVLSFSVNFLLFDEYVIEMLIEILNETWVFNSVY